MELMIDETNGRENRACLGRRVIGEASVLKTYVSETITRGQRQAKVCSVRASYFRKPS
jgi:hypothetical protein